MELVRTIVLGTQKDIEWQTYLLSIERLYSTIALCNVDDFLIAYVGRLAKQVSLLRSCGLSGTPCDPIEKTGEL